MNIIRHRTSRRRISLCFFLCFFGGESGVPYIYLRRGKIFVFDEEKKSGRSKKELSGVEWRVQLLVQCFFSKFYGCVCNGQVKSDDGLMGREGDRFWGEGVYQRGNLPSCEVYDAMQKQLSNISGMNTK